MIDIEKIANSDAMKRCVEGFDDIQSNNSQVIILIAIAEQLKRIADVQVYVASINNYYKEDECSPKKQT